MDMFIRIIMIAILMLLWGCENGNGGIGGTGDGSGKGQALLGPVVDAQVELYAYDDLDTPLCSTSTSRSDNIDVAGLFSIPSDCFEKDGLYVVAVKGGEDIDSNDDRIVDDPLSVEGTFRALISGEQLLEQEWHVTAVSEALFQSLQYQLSQNKSSAELLEIADELAKYFITQDLNNDGQLDNRDILAWNPQSVDSAQVRSSQSLTMVVDDIHSGKNTTNESIELNEVVIGHLDTLAQAENVFIKDNIAYVTTGSALLTIDITDPRSPVLLGALSTGWIEDVEFNEKFAFIALGSAGLQVVDLSDLSTLKVVGSLDQTVYQLEIVGENLLFANDTDDGYELGIIAVNDGKDPELLSVSQFNSWGHLSLFEARNNTAVVINDDGIMPQLGIIDISDLASPLVVLQDDFGSSSFAHDLVFRNNYLYLAVSGIFPEDGGVVLYDVSNPADPIKITTYEHVQPWAFSIAGDVAFAWQDDKLTFLTADGLVEVGEISLPNLFQDDIDIWAIYDVVMNITPPPITAHHPHAIEGDKLFVASAKNGLVIIDLPAIANFNTIGFNEVMPLVGATVEVRRLSNLTPEVQQLQSQADAVNCTSVTLDNADFSHAGYLELDPSCIRETGYYLITLQGGNNWDANNDGLRDEQPTPFNGALHAVFERNALLVPGWTMTALQEWVYQQTANLIDKQLSYEEWKNALNGEAWLLLKSTELEYYPDYDYLVSWRKSMAKDLLTFDSNYLGQMVEEIIAAGDIQSVIRNAMGPMKGYLPLSDGYENYVLEQHGTLGAIYNQRRLEWASSIMLVDFADGTTPKITATIYPTMLIMREYELMEYFPDVLDWQVSYPFDYSKAYQIKDVKIVGNQLFVAVDRKGILVFDISDPYNPVYQELIITEVIGMTQRDGKLFYASLQDDNASVDDGNCAIALESSSANTQCNSASHDYHLQLTVRGESETIAELALEKIEESPQWNSIDLNVFDNNLFIKIDDIDHDKLRAFTFDENILVEGPSWVGPLGSNINAIVQQVDKLYVDIVPSHDADGQVTGDRTLVSLDSTTLQEKASTSIVNNNNLKNNELLSIIDMAAMGDNLVLVDEKSVVHIYDPIQQQIKSSIDLPNKLTAKNITVIGNLVYVITQAGLIVLDAEALQ